MTFLDKGNYMFICFASADDRRASFMFHNACSIDFDKKSQILKTKFQTTRFLNTNCQTTRTHIRSTSSSLCIFQKCLVFISDAYRHTSKCLLHTIATLVRLCVCQNKIINQFTYLLKTLHTTSSVHRGKLLLRTGQRRKTVSRTRAHRIFYFLSFFPVRYTVPVA